MQPEMDFATRPRSSTGAIRRNQTLIDFAEPHAPAIHVPAARQSTCDIEKLLSGEHGPDAGASASMRTSLSPANGGVCPCPSTSTISLTSSSSARIASAFVLGSARRRSLPSERERVRPDQLADFLKFQQFEGMSVHHSARTSFDAARFTQDPIVRKWKTNLERTKQLPEDIVDLSKSIVLTAMPMDWNWSE